MSYERVEAKLDAALAVAVAKGWMPTRKHTFFSAHKQCCALGALWAADESIPRTWSFIERKLFLPIDQCSDIANGFDSIEPRLHANMELYRIGQRLAEKYVK